MLSGIVANGSAVMSAQHRGGSMPRAAVMYAPNTPFIIEDIEVGRPRHGEALVRVAASGVCHSNLHFMHGAIPSPFPIIFGEEGIGVVEAVGPGVTTVQP